MKFCEYCGAKMTKEWTGKYNEDNGMKEMKLRCSRKPCCFRHGTIIPKKGFWNRIMSIGSCERCGKALSMDL